MLSFATFLWRALPTSDAHAQDSRRAIEACSADSEAAQRDRKEGKLLSAQEKFRVCARETCPSVISKFCVQRLVEIDAALPTLVVRARDGSGNDIVDLDVWVDEMKVGKTDGRAIGVDPGRHAVRLQRGGAVVAQPSSLLLAEGEKLRNLVVSVAPELGSDTTERPAEKPSVLPPVLGGMGLAFIGVGVFMWASGLSDRDDELKPMTGCAPNCGDDVTSSIRTRLIIGDAFAAAGLVAVGVAAYLMFRPAPSAPPSRSASFARQK